MQSVRRKFTHIAPRVVVVPADTFGRDASHVTHEAADGLARTAGRGVVHRASRCWMRCHVAENLHGRHRRYAVVPQLVAAERAVLNDVEQRRDVGVVDGRRRASIDVQAARHDEDVAVVVRPQLPPLRQPAEAGNHPRL